MLQHVLPDGVHQVRLAESHAAVDEQRVVGAGRRLGDGAAGRVGELVRRADDEGVERVAGVEAAERGGRLRVLGRLGRLLGGRLAFCGGRRGPVAVGQDPDRARVAADLGQRLVQHRRVVPEQPVLEIHVGDADGHELRRFREELAGLEPGDERVPVHLGLDPPQHPLPDVPLVHCSRPFAPPRPADSPRDKADCRRLELGLFQRKRATFAPPRPAPAVCHAAARRSGPEKPASRAFRPVRKAEFWAFPPHQARPWPAFPHLFPQLWKTLVVDRNRDRFRVSGRARKVCQCSTIAGGPAGRGRAKRQGQGTSRCRARLQPRSSPAGRTAGPPEWRIVDTTGKDPLLLIVRPLSQPRAGLLRAPGRNHEAYVSAE